MWTLVIEDDEGKRVVVPLTRDDYSIGRNEGNTIRLTERNVSREHARLRKKAVPSHHGLAQNGNDKGTYVLEDLSSYNGVFVNGVRVTKAQDLAHGDLIQIGDYRIVFQDDVVTMDEEVTVDTDEQTSTIPNPILQARVSPFLERPNRLVMLSAPSPGAEYALDRDRLTIGRAEDANISVNHNSVSRLHCEVHALGEGRFEIVDKGSSNGVRVNGADLRRGIIEAGDVIELGDVRMKFVGKGQIFLPSLHDTQDPDLETLVDREITAKFKSPRASTVIPYVLLGAVVAAVAVGAWAYSHERGPAAGATITNATASSPQANDLSALNEAKALCDMGNCDIAHDKLVAGLPSSSPLRNTADFRNIELRWADMLLARADAEEDVAKRRALLHNVEGAPTVDDARRKLAADKLQALDSAQGLNLDQLPVASNTPPPERSAPVESAPRKGTANASQSAQSSTAAASHSSTKPPATATSVADQARAIMLSDPAAARSLLERKVLSGRGTREEVSLLKTICKNQHDQICVSTCNQLLGQ